MSIYNTNKKGKNIFFSNLSTFFYISTDDQHSLLSFKVTLSGIFPLFLSNFLANVYVCITCPGHRNYSPQLADRRCALRISATFVFIATIMQEQ